jgi:hypothetical protein
MRAGFWSVGAVHQAGQPVGAVAGQPPVQGHPGDPELEGYDVLWFATFDREDCAVSLLDDGQLHQSQSRPPITVHTGQ